MYRRVAPPHGIMFHHLHGGIHARSPGSISAAELESMIRFLDPDRILTPPEWIARTREHRLGALDLCLTFDDAPRSQHDLAVPVLRALGLTAFFFVPTAHLDGEVPRLELHRWFRSTRFGGIDHFEAAFEAQLARGPMAARVAAALGSFDPSRYLTEFPFYSEADRRFRFLRDEILGPAAYARTMGEMMDEAAIDAAVVGATLLMGASEIRSLQQDGHAVGLHSHSHPTRLASLPAAEQDRELRTNHDVLVGLLGSKPSSMSHPNGSYGRDTLRILRELGIEVGFRSSMQPVVPLVPPLEQPREDHTNVMALMWEGADRS